jgi:hypothetical protein
MRPSGACIEAATERGHVTLVVDEVVGEDIVRCGNGAHGGQSQMLVSWCVGGEERRRKWVG